MTAYTIPELLPTVIFFCYWISLPGCVCVRDLLLSWVMAAALLLSSTGDLPHCHAGAPLLPGYCVRSVCVRVSSYLSSYRTQMDHGSC